MIRSSKYMIKRIIIGIGIAIGVMCFKNYVSFAATIDGTITWGVDQTSVVSIATNDYKYVPASSPRMFWLTGLAEEDAPATYYFNMILCVNTESTEITGSAWSQSNLPNSSSQTIKNTSLNITNVPCKFVGAYPGKVAQVQSVTQGAYGDISLAFLVSFNQNVSYQLQNYSISNEPYKMIENIADYTTQLNDMSNAITSTINNMSTIINNSLNNNQAQTNQWLQKVEAAQKAMKEAMESDDIDDSFNNSKIGEIAGKQYGNASISDIVLLPVKLLQASVNGLSSNSCSDITLGNLYGTDLTLSCISSSDMTTWLGSTLYTIIDILLSFGVILGIRKLVLKIYNTIIFLKEGGGTID